MKDQTNHFQGGAKSTQQIWFSLQEQDDNAVWKPEDFHHICAHGKGGKRGSGKIGKHRVGYCAAYHLTDLPSILSDEKLQQLDPHVSRGICCQTWNARQFCEGQFRCKVHRPICSISKDLAKYRARRRWVSHTHAGHTFPTAFTTPREHQAWMWNTRDDGHTPNGKSNNYTHISS